METTKRTTRRIAALAVMAFLALAAMVSCTDSESTALRQKVEESARLCPLHVADGMVIDTITYQDNTVTYRVSVDTPLIDLQVLEAKKDILAPALVDLINENAGPQLRDDLDLCRKAKARLQFVITGQGREVTFDMAEY